MEMKSWNAAPKKSKQANKKKVEIFGGGNFYVLCSGGEGLESISKLCWTFRGTYLSLGWPRRISTDQFNVKVCCKKTLIMFAFNLCLIFTNISIMLIVTNM